jgi:3-deoxy-D-manno-octulosonate 8-phosphate phosphatase KdsC-like HAD superfamily phosphatase
MGNDINDVECMSWASVAIAPTDAHHSALEVANFVTSRRGGDGAVREITDLLMDAHAARLMADIE